MTFRRSCRGCIAPNFVRVNVRAAVDPGSSPASVVDENRVPTPIKSGKPGAPAPRPEGRSDRHPEAEANRATDYETRPWSDENDRWAVIRHNDESRIDGRNRDVRTAADDDLGIRSQISVVISLAAFSLNGVHYVLLLRQECVSQVCRPAHIGSHHVQHRWEWQQRLHAGSREVGRLEWRRPELAPSGNGVDPPSGRRPEPGRDRWRLQKSGPAMGPDKARRAPPSDQAGFAENMAVPAMAAVPAQKSERQRGLQARKPIGRPLLSCSSFDPPVQR